MKKNILFFTAYFLLALSIGVCLRDTVGQPDLYSNIFNFYSGDTVSKMGDPVSFSQGALDIYQTGWITPENIWIIKLWPPGLILLEGAILKIFGVTVPFIFVLLLINSALVGITLSAMRTYFLDYVSPVIAGVLPGALFLFPVSRLTLLEPAGLLLGEGISILLFMLSMALALLAVKRCSLRGAIYSGFALGFAAYFRSQFEIVLTILTLLAVIICLICVCKQRNKSMFRWSSINISIKTIVIALAVAHAVMMPWRIYNIHSIGKPVWVVTEHLVYANAGRSDKDLYANGGGWLVEGGENTACKVELSYCGKSNKYDFYMAFINHPLEWVGIKARLIPKYWFASLNDFSGVTAANTVTGMVFNIVIAIFIIANCLLLIFIKRDASFYILSWSCLGFYICNVCIFILVHLETRYFYALKIYSIFLFIILMSIVFGIFSTQKNKMLH